MQFQQQYPQQQVAQPPNGYQNNEAKVYPYQVQQGQPVMQQEMMVYQQQQQQINYSYGQPGAQVPAYTAPPSSDLQKFNIDVLDTLPAVYIQQQFNTAQFVLDCVMQNRYKVYGADVNGKNTGNDILTVQEDSSFLARNCLPVQCRSFRLFGLDHATGVTLFESKKDFNCSCLCFCRPELDIHYTSLNDGILFAKIRYPFNCTVLQMLILSKEGALKYTIRGSVCQLGFCCKCMPCTPCQECNFEIFDAHDVKVGLITKQTAGCCRGFYSVVFPKNISKYDKLYILMGAIFINYMCFEDRPQQEE